MVAVLWIHDARCRVLVKDDAGRVIYTDDSWNNRLSAESMVAAAFPQAQIRFVRDPREVHELNVEWNACVLGVSGMSPQSEIDRAYSARIAEAVAVLDAVRHLLIDAKSVEHPNWGHIGTVSAVINDLSETRKRVVGLG